ncbi:MAG: hypothetical protein RIR79_2184 [Pseudomonadota bacterium]|jgi:gamma-glutamyltranspeptidase/glutathione hydrolase
MFALASQPALQPEGASAIVQKSGWATKTYAVAAANPLATQAGQQILQAGGSAVDAAIAVQMVLTLVEPQSSGIGGGAFLLHFDGKRVQAFDGRETAPTSATPDLFLQADGKPMPFKDAVVSGRSIGVLGVLPMLALAHQQHGRLPWARLLQPAIALATTGFPIGERMATLLATETALRHHPAARAYFFDADGKPWKQGHILKNPELAAVLQAIADKGAAALTQGEIAHAIVRTAPRLSVTDLANYQAIERPPLCFDYRNYRICGMPPPSSGAIAIQHILERLPHTPKITLNADWLHQYTEASRHAFAYRAQFVADPAFMDKVTTHYAPMPHQLEYGTSHISVVDAYGNALAMTTSIEDAWGSRHFVNRGVGLAGGFLLNNQLTDFSFNPADATGKPIANRVEAGKRPRSSMSPTLVLDKASGKLVLTTGSPGGAFIIHFTAKTLIGVLDWGLNAQEAINLPNFGTISGAADSPLFLEHNRFDRDTITHLQARGNTVQEIALPSGIQAIQRTHNGYFGGADPRREGVVMGD